MQQSSSEQSSNTMVFFTEVCWESSVLTNVDKEESRKRANENKTCIFIFKKKSLNSVLNLGK